MLQKPTQLLDNKKIKIYIIVAILLAIVVVLANLYLSSTRLSRDISTIADITSQKVSILQKNIFSNTPPLKKDFDKCIFLFNGVEDRLSAALRIKYKIPKDFKYSLSGILLQNKKELLSLLNSNYKLLVAWNYTPRKIKYYTVAYVIIMPNDSWPNVPPTKLLLPTRPASGTIYIENMEINGSSILTLLCVTIEGDFLNQEDETLFLQKIKDLGAFD